MLISIRSYCKSLNDRVTVIVEELSDPPSAIQQILRWRAKHAYDLGKMCSRTTFLVLDVLAIKHTLAFE